MDGWMDGRRDVWMMMDAMTDVMMDGCNRLGRGRGCLVLFVRDWVWWDGSWAAPEC